MTPEQYPVTYFEAALLLSSLADAAPATARTLTGMGGGRHRRARLAAYVRAGLLTEERRSGRTLYALTPDGETFAALLHRLEMARETD